MGSYIHFILWAIIQYCYLLKLFQLWWSFLSFAFLEYLTYQRSSAIWAQHHQKCLAWDLVPCHRRFPVYTHVAISPRFPSLCAQFTNVKSHLSSSWPPVMISEPGCMVPTAASENRNVVEVVKGQGPAISGLHRDLWECREQGVEIHSHEVLLTVPLTSLISGAIGGLRQVMNLV